MLVITHRVQASRHPCPPGTQIHHKDLATCHQTGTCVDAHLCLQSGSVATHHKTPQTRSSSTAAEAVLRSPAFASTPAPAAAAATQTRRPGSGAAHQRHSSHTLATWLAGFGPGRVRGRRRKPGGGLHGGSQQPTALRCDPLDWTHRGSSRASGRHRAGKLSPVLFLLQPGACFQIEKTLFMQVDNSVQ